MPYRVVAIMPLDHAKFLSKLAILQKQQSDAAFARKIGVTASTLQQWKKKSIPSLAAAVQITEACGVPLDFFVSDASQLPIAPEDADKRLNAVEELLNAEMVFPIAKERSAAYAELRSDLDAISTDKRLPDRIRARADLHLRLAFNDPEANERNQKRLQRRRADMKRAEVALADAIAVVGWQPPEATYQTLFTIVLEYGMGGEPLLMLLRDMQQLEQRGQEKADGRDRLG